MLSLPKILRKTYSKDQELKKVPLLVVESNLFHLL
jgi:hypothetical protein